MKNPIRILWIILGFISLGLGTVGIALPILPTVPFYLATVFCFAKSLKRLHDWFIGVLIGFESPTAPALQELETLAIIFMTCLFS